jgi:signal transduction histidine kinase
MADRADETEDDATPRAPARRYGLSSKLLVLTVLFVMLSEVLIYVPSIANFQKTEIEDRLQTASVAAHALMAIDAGSVPADLQAELLKELDASAIAVQAGGIKRLIAMAETPPETVTREIRIDRLSPADAIRSAFDTLLFGDRRTIRATDRYGADGEIDVVFSEEGLRQAMLLYSRNILVLSIVISTLSAVLVYLSLRWLFVRPMQRIGRAIAVWSADPENPQLVIQPSPRRDEFGIAEEQLADMQLHVQDVLKQQRRLADLGLAVSKINHDLRNLLASAQLMSDRLTAIPDPTVQRFAPKLIDALDRAITYAQAVLAYGKAQEAPPKRRVISLHRLVSEVADVTGVAAHATIEWVNAVPADLEIDADTDQLFRVLLNLVRNAAQALEAGGDGAVVRRLSVTGERIGSVVRIKVSDTGPGVPERAREHLFKPFQGSVRRGGTGLGLAIAAELVRAHGGSIALAGDGPGAVFEIEIPDRPVPFPEIRRTRAG